MLMKCSSFIKNCAVAVVLGATVAAFYAMCSSHLVDCPSCGKRQMVLIPMFGDNTVEETCPQCYYMFPIVQKVFWNIEYKTLDYEQLEEDVRHYYDEIPLEETCPD